MSYEKLVATIRGSFYETLIVVALISIAFISFEPTISRAVSSDTSEFTVTQTIGDEISFLTAAADVTMSPSLNGLTGGQATGTTYVVIRTNSATGYTLDIRFASATAMYRNGGNGEINNYSPNGTTSPTANFDIGGSNTPGEFGYTVNASTSYHVAPEFRGDGTLCNIGASGVATQDKCWQAPSTSDKEIINSTSSTAATGATTTIRFVVEIPSSPLPVIPSGEYQATVTLTATTQ